MDPNDFDWLGFNSSVIDEFRANAGQVGGRWEGNPMILLTTVGARSGRERISPLTYTMDGERIVVIASRAGADRHPDWFHNLVVNPDVTVELGEERFGARASIAAGEERQRILDERIAVMPRFGDYVEMTDREIPVVVLDRISNPG